MDDWVARAAADVARTAERDLEALVAVSSPSGDIAGAEEAFAVCTALTPAAAAVERVPCSSEGHAPDLLATLSGDGERRIVLVGHVDTVVAHADHRPLERDEGMLVGSGTVDMKGGVVLALGAMRALAEIPEAYAEVALLLVCDEEWRVTDLVHGPRFEGFDACLCFEAGELTADGTEAVVVRRKAAGTLIVEAHGAAAHSGSAPELGRNALLALATTAEQLAARNDPAGSERLTVVPTVMHAGEAFNVVPGEGELVCDLRADSLEAFGPVRDSVPAEVEGVILDARLLRGWPGMDSTAASTEPLARAASVLGRPIAAAARGGASDASWIARHVGVAIDGLGPLGGAAHAPDEYVLAASLASRAEVALAVVAAVLDGRE